MPKPGGTVARGYGPAHQRARKTWAPLVARGGVVCARYICGREIVPGQPWDVGHVDAGSSGGPEHRLCNRQAGARTANRRRGYRRAVLRGVASGGSVFGPLSR